MRFNSFKQKLQAGQPAIGVFSAVRSSLAAAMLARGRCDYVVLDSQHGEWDDASRTEAIRALYLQQVVPVVRVRANDYGLIGRALDSGALGVVIPMVNSAAEARAAAEAMRYPPEGGRSGADNLSAHLGNDYHSWANQEVFWRFKSKQQQLSPTPRPSWASKGSTAVWSALLTWPFLWACPPGLPIIPPQSTRFCRPAMPPARFLVSSPAPPHSPVSGSTQATALSLSAQIPI